MDRGKKSVEVVVLLFAYLLLYPDYMHLNRGNHEDHIMNLRWVWKNEKGKFTPRSPHTFFLFFRYGFTKEVMQKYKVEPTYKDITSSSRPYFIYNYVQ